MPPTAPTPQTPSPSGARTIAAGVSFTLVSRLISTAAALFTQILLARWLGPDGNGLLATAMADLAIAMLLADLGLNGSISRLLARAYYRDPAAIPRIIRLAALAKGLLTIAVGTVLLAGSGLISEVVHTEAALAPVLMMAGVQLVLDNAATFSFRGLQGLHRPREQAVAQAVSGVASPLLALALTALCTYGVITPLIWRGRVVAGFELGAAAAVLGRALGAALAAGLAGFWLLRIARRSANTEPAGEAGPLGGLMGEMTSVAYRLLFVNLAFLVVFRMDVAIVQTMLGRTAAGYYALPALMAEKIMMPAQVLSVVVAPYFAALDDPSRGEFLRGIYERAVHLILALYAPASAGLFILAPEIVQVVFGEAYRPSVPLLRIYALLLLLTGLANFLGPILDYGGLASRRALAFGAAAAAHLGISIALIPHVGAAAPLCALGITFLPLVGFYLLTLARRVGAQVLGWRRLMGTILATAGMAAIVLALRAPSPEATSPVRLAALVAAGALAYAVLLPLLGGASRDDVRALRSLARRGNAR
ncbi:MAG: oligosaccharide flippase family protein [Planctomycetota bacterium]|jgi:O-antigen/teichoic acid export membrane protein